MLAEPKPDRKAHKKASQAENLLNHIENVLAKYAGENEKTRLHVVKNYVEGDTKGYIEVRRSGRKMSLVTIAVNTEREYAYRYFDNFEAVNYFPLSEIDDQLGDVHDFIKWWPN